MNLQDIPVVIFAGGRGIRLGQTFGDIPKALVPVNGTPIVQHLINHFLQFGVREFYILGGHKINLLRSYFQDSMLSNHTIFDFETKTTESVGINSKYKIHVINTGEFASTQSRLFQIKEKLKDYKYFFLTYGDGLSFLNIDELFDFHVTEQATVTLTAVKPSSKFGELNLKENKVFDFHEKDKFNQRWVNAGFMCVSSTGMENLLDSKLMFEQDYLPKIAKKGELSAFKYEGFWQSMDTPKDHADLEKILKDTVTANRRE
jgi:glucose-1-phosphate cytidylyltransferase